MLENIREKSQGTGAKIILGLVIVTFAFAGIGSYTNSVDTSVAEVNGEKISQADFDSAFQNQRNRMAQQYGQMFESLLADPTYLNNLRNDVLNGLINETLLDQHADELAIRISDERIKETILSMPEFQVDGVFDNERYLALIQQAGFRESSNFRDYLRVQMARQLLTQSVVASEFSLPFEMAMVTELRDQKRDLKFATIKAAQFNEQVAVTEEEIASYYQANQVNFQSDEQAKVNYVLLDVKEIAKAITTSEDEAKAYYQDNITSFTTPAKRRLAHILIESGDDAKAKAEELLGKVKGGEDFAALAKTHSADTFSAQNGGDLDWLEPGVMVPAFEQAAMALTEAGQISDIVETEFGFHIIKLTEFEAEAVTPFEDAKADVMAKVANEAAQTKFFELKDKLGRIAYEVPDNLDEAAAAVNGQVNTSDWIKRAGNAAPFNSPAVIEAVFSDVVVKENLNSELIEVSDEIAVVVHINDYQAAQTKPLATVSEEINTLLTEEKAAAKTKEVAQELLASYVAGTDISEQLTALDASFTEQAAVGRLGSEVNGNIVRKAFTLPHPSEGAISASTVELSNGDIALVEVKAVTKGETQELPPQMAQQFASQLARSAYVAYVTSLSDDAEIKRKNQLATADLY